MALSWDKIFLEMAKSISKKSKDPSTQVGAILVSPDNRQIACGYNGFPSCIPDDEEVLSKDCDMAPDNIPTLRTNKGYRLTDPGKGLNKYDLVIHAEENAIINCHTRPTGWTLYCTHIPCSSCAKTIAGSGISKVVCKKQTGKTDLNYDKTEKIFIIAKIYFKII